MRWGLCKLHSFLGKLMMRLPLIPKRAFNNSNKKDCVCVCVCVSEADEVLKHLFLFVYSYAFIFPNPNGLIKGKFLMPIGGFVSSAYSTTRFAVSPQKIIGVGTWFVSFCSNWTPWSLSYLLCWNNYKAIDQQLSDLQFSNLVEYSLVLVMLHLFLKCDCGSEQGC